MTAMTEKPLLDEDTIADLTEKIVSALKTVYDPEIPVDIYELGLIYKVDIDDLNNFDFVLDTTSLSYEEVFEKVISFIDQCIFKN